MMEFEAFQRSEYKSIRQPLSGYRMGYESYLAWGVRLKLGPSSFWHSVNKYKSFDEAHRAAQRLNKKHAATQERE